MYIEPTEGNWYTLVIEATEGNWYILVIEATEVNWYMCNLSYVYSELSCYEPTEGNWYIYMYAMNLLKETGIL